MQASQFFLLSGQLSATILIFLILICSPTKESFYMINLSKKYEPLLAYKNSNIPYREALLLCADSHGTEHVSYIQILP